MAACLSLAGNADAQRARGGSGRPIAPARPAAANRAAVPPARPVTAARAAPVAARATTPRATIPSATIPRATTPTRRGGLGGTSYILTPTATDLIGGNLRGARFRPLLTGPVIVANPTAPLTDAIVAQRRVGVYGGVASLLGADYAFAARASFGVPLRPLNVNRPWAGRYPWYHGGWNGWGAWPAPWNGVAPDNSRIVYVNPFVPVVPAVGGPRQISLELSPSLRAALDYTRPIQRSAREVRPEVVEAAHARMDAARAAFRRGDYREGLEQASRAVELLHEDANLHEFRALTLFALGRYRQAAQTLYAVLASEPGWTWETMRSFYPNAETYTEHLRELETHVEDEPDDTAARFVLAYHYLVLDERAEALEQLREVVRREPEDRLSASLVDALTRGGMKRRDKK